MDCAALSKELQANKADIKLTADAPFVILNIEPPSVFLKFEAGILFLRMRPLNKSWLATKSGREFHQRGKAYCGH